MTNTPLPGSFSPTAVAEITFLPLADPERRRLDPLGALTAGHDLRIVLGIGEADAVRHARQAGTTWEEIAAAAGISRQAAHAKWSVAADALAKSATRAFPTTGPTSAPPGSTSAPSRPGGPHRPRGRSAGA